MNRVSLLASIVLMSVFGLLSSRLSAEQAAPYQPRIKNNKAGSFQDFPMGVLSATGRLADGEREMVVRHVGKGGAAEKGGLRAGDRIVSIEGRTPGPYSKSTDSGVTGAQLDLAMALQQTCAAEYAHLRLEVRRGDETMTLKMAVPKSPTFADSFPDDCAKSAKLLSGIAGHLLATQRKDGSWRPGVGGDADVYLSAFCALALLAADQDENLPAIRNAIGFLKRKSISQSDPAAPREGPKNWQAAATAILLAEYQLATGDDSFFEDLATSCDLLAARVARNGTMGHHFDIPYDGTGLVIINVQAHLAWALAGKCGYEVDRDAWKRSLDEVRAAIDQETGALGYSARARLSPDISARTGAMAAALTIAGEEPKLAKQFADALVRSQGRMRYAHSMSSIGMIYGLAGLKLAHPEGHREVMRKWIPWLELSRNAAGSAAYFGGKRNIGGDEYLGLEPIGNATVALVLASAEGKLFMHGGTKRGWFGGRGLEDIEYLSAADNTMQRAMWFDPRPEKPVPLVVALHTWSGDYKQQHHRPIREWCMKKGWAYIHPDFRGPARDPEATGSELVVKDVVSAVEFAKKTTRIDGSAVFLVGTSGGGYHCLVMAGKHPELWAGVSAWASISDLEAWYHDNVRSGRKYADDIVKSCGGKPGDSPGVDAEYRKRSPLTYLANARGKVRLHINTGITDGHTGSVPISHSLLAFNEVADPKDRLSSEEIRFFTEKAQVPETLEKAGSDPAYGEKQPLFRRSSGTATVTIFEGGHEIVPEAAMAWMENLREQDRKKAFVEFPETTSKYLKRIQGGLQAHAFDPSKDFGNWQAAARAALIEATGLRRMGEELGAFEPKVSVGEAEEAGGQFTRSLCTIETEPGISIPFYLLVPKTEEENERFPLLLCPHGHDSRGLHSYAGAFKDEGHRKKILGREGNIAEQAALRGIVAIAPATRGLAEEAIVPDPRGRHGNRPCRAQLMHCLVAGRTPLAERVWDMQRILDWAERHPRIDRERIAMTGNSGGGVLTAYTAAIDERIKVAIPSCSFTSVTSSEGFIFHCDCCLVPGLRDWGDWAEIGGLVAPRHLLLVHGMKDGLHSRRDVEKAAASVREIFRSAGVPHRFDLKWGTGGHRFYPELMWPFVEKGLE